MNYKNLVFTFLMTASFMNNGVETPKTRNLSSFIFSIPGVLGATTLFFMLKGGRHWCMSDFHTKLANTGGNVEGERLLQDQKTFIESPEYRNLTQAERDKQIDEVQQHSKDAAVKASRTQAAEHKKKFWSALKISAVPAVGLGVYFLANHACNQPSSASTTTERSK